MSKRNDVLIEYLDRKEGDGKTLLQYVAPATTLEAALRALLADKPHLGRKNIVNVYRRPLVGGGWVKYNPPQKNVVFARVWEEPAPISSDKAVMDPRNWVVICPRCGEPLSLRPWLVPTISFVPTNPRVVCDGCGEDLAMIAQKLLNRNLETLERVLGAPVNSLLAELVLQTWGDMLAAVDEVAEKHPRWGEVVERYWFGKDLPSLREVGRVMGMRGPEGVRQKVRKVSLRVTAILLRGSGAFRRLSGRWPNTQMPIASTTSASRAEPEVPTVDERLEYYLQHGMDEGLARKAAALQLEKLGLSTRVVNLISRTMGARAGVIDLIAHTTANLLILRNSGPVAVAEIEAALERFGLRLRTVEEGSIPLYEGNKK